MSETKTFDVRNFGGTLREITFFRTRQLGRTDDAQSFWQAQQDVVALRKKLERAYNSTVQKAKHKKQITPELWIFGLFAYHKIVLEMLSLEDFQRLSNAKIAREATKLAEPIVKASEALRESDEAWETPYLFEKLMPEVNDATD